MTLTMTLQDLLRLAHNDLDSNFFEVRDLFTEQHPEAPITNGAMAEFILDQFKQNLEQKGITLKVI
jgi:hypothetical protein